MFSIENLLDGIVGEYLRSTWVVIEIIHIYGLQTSDKDNILIRIEARLQKQSPV